MLNLVIFGAPGSGKGTQSEILIEQYGLDHISTGDILRGEIKAGSELGKAAKGYIDAGQLVPDGLIIDMIEKVLGERKPKKGIILDGFPRTVAQAEALDALFAKLGTRVHAVLDLQVEEAELIDRLLKRGQESGRSDDNLETIQKRLGVYHAQTAPIAAHYAQQGVHHAIQGSGAISDITARIARVLDTLAQ
ncbi:adenylate kinase [uncultured Porphyromonas sp.]|jgi:adenylate kinase|uniref:adenylate kinase n=2 Tax=uncultured Porphyromonas sp. TaxID=159274 RepID=UPI002623D06A|nr:adenylate kinase [uncultured Porphyromonas sp.]